MAHIVNFSDAASIALHSLILIARKGKALNAVQLSDELGNSKFNISKILQRLVKDGYLVSYRGPSGGFDLKKLPEDITLYEVYKSVEGEIENKECSHHISICPPDKCIYKSVTKRMTGEFIDFMRSQKVADYI